MSKTIFHHENKILDSLKQAFGIFGNLFGQHKQIETKTTYKAITVQEETNVS